MYHNLVYNDILFIVNSVLIEKILRTEPDVGKMYLLIKAKNKEAAMERLQNEVFFIFHVIFVKVHDLTFLLSSHKNFILCFIDHRHRTFQMP